MKKRFLHFILTLICFIIFFHAHAQQSITVDDLPQPKMPETLITEGNIFVKAFLSKSSCVVNEPVLVTYKFYTRLNGQSKVSQLPTFTGCSVQEMTTENTFPELEEINGKTFKSYIVRKVQLYPLHAGDIALGSASVENIFSIYNPETTLEDYRNGTGGRQNKTVIVSSDPVTIHVSDFPEKNRPTNFDGAVGSFTIKAMVNKRNDTANENNSLQILIEGEGGFQNVSCPIIAWPKNIEAFEATTTEMVNKVVYPATGGKSFDIPFVAKVKGKFTIPAISFSFYDMQTHEYKTISTEDITINVAEAKANNIDPTKVHADITNFRYIWIVPAIALLAGIGWWLRFGRTKQPMPQQMIAAADKMIEAETIKEIERETIKEQTDVAKLNKLLLTDNDIEFFKQAKLFCQELLLKQTDATKKSSLETLINECNAVLYASSTAISKDEMLRKLEGIIT